MSVKFHQIREHTIDILFPLVVFFVFAASAVTVILLAANIYSNSVQGSARMYNSATALSYIQEKLHQNDVSGGVRIEELDGTKALVLEQSHEGQRYCTYIYACDGTLRELFTRQELEFDPEEGRQLLKAREFDCSWLKVGLLQIRYTDDAGNEETACVSVQSIAG